MELKLHGVYFATTSHKDKFLSSYLGNQVSDYTYSDISSCVFLFVFVVSFCFFGCDYLVQKEV